MKRKKTLKRKSLKRRPLKRRTLKRRTLKRRRRRRRTKLTRKRGGAETGPKEMADDVIDDKLNRGRLDVNDLTQEEKDLISSSLSTMKGRDSRKYSDIIMSTITKDPPLKDENLKVFLNTVGETKIDPFGWQDPDGFGDKLGREELPLMDILNDDDCCRGSLKNKEQREKVKKLLAAGTGEVALSAALWGGVGEAPPAAEPDAGGGDREGHCIIS